MFEKELMELVDSVIATGDKKYVTPSGAFLELLRRRALELNLDGFIESCNAYYKIFPINKQFILHRIPAILVNNYFTMRTDLNYDKFIQWSLNNSDWSEYIMQSSVTAQALQLCVDDIVSKANDYTA